MAGAELKVKSRVVGLEFEKSSEVTVSVRETTHTVSHKAKVVVSADGIDSAVGRWGGIDSSVGLSHAVSCAQRLVLTEEVDFPSLETNGAIQLLAPADRSPASPGEIWFGRRLCGGSPPSG